MAEQQTAEAGEVVDPVSKRCRDGLHLWCGALAGRFGQWPCACECHHWGARARRAA